MNDNDIKTLPQIRAFLDGTQAVEFSINTRSDLYDFVRRTLIRLAYHTLSKSDKGVVLSFLVHVSGYSRIQVKRLASVVKARATTTRYQRGQWLFPQVHRRRPAGRAG
ncbi:MAG: hypothetical protein U9R22_11670 [Pseudomonadota bacterium]|nr:hypothetical protein [Pseudomonadota bacterium]